MNQDIIDKLKANKEAFGLMDKELQEAAREIGKKGNFEFFSSCNEWNGGVSVNFRNYRTYRLRPDYEPEPKVIRCKIYESEDHLHFMHDSSEHSIGQACDQANFAGFEFDMLDDNAHSEMWLNLDLEYNGNHKWTHASHVRFSK